MSAWLLTLSMLLNPNGCATIHGDQITGEDLVKALPVFSVMPGDAVIALSPVPGVRRVFAYPELARIGKKYGIDAPANARACFEWKMQPLTEDAVRAAMRETLESPDARVTILAMSKAQIPEGKLVFPLSGLAASTNVEPTTPVTWRGEVLYHSAHTITVWARVRISATMTRVVAREMILPGKPVSASAVRLETLEDFPLRDNFARNLDEVVGRLPLHAIQPESPVLRVDLREPFQVQRGEDVRVTAISGAAQLTLQAVAETSGKQGDLITLKNPQTGKTFSARVDGKGQALVVTGPFAVLMGVQ